METLATASHWVGTGLITLQAGWMTLGACTNVRCPKHNMDLVNNVLSMELIREESPELYQRLNRRVVANPLVRKRIFRVLMFFEMLVSIGLWSAVVLMVLAGFGQADPAFAKSVALFSVFAFTAIWGGFLVGGEWFAYYASSKSPQYTHFHMLLWGVGTLVFLS